MKFIATVLVLSFLLLCSCETKNNSNVLTVATAANMQFAMDAIAGAFEKEHQIKIELAINSSGMLTSQIMNGAPYDIFVSANMKYPNQLHQEGFSSSPVIYAQGEIVLNYRGDFDEVAWQDILLSESVKRIAVANPQTAPYGMAAVEALKTAGIFEELKSKLVYGESIGQVNQYILSKSVDAAFTSNSFAYKFAASYQFYETEITGYSPINQGAIVIKNYLGKTKKASELFIAYLASKECKAILFKHGYRVDE